MRSREFLLEYDRSREQQRIESLPAYAERLKQDPSFSLEKLESADPTTQKTYVPRLATWWMRGAKIEDLISRGADNLEKFAQLKQKNQLKPEHKDINVFKQFADFEDVISSYQQPNQPEEKQDRGKYKEIFRDAELLVVQLLDKTAAQFWGQSTKWCTAAKKNNMYDVYAKHGPLFVIIPRKDPANKYQYWFDSKEPYEIQFMNVQDESVNPQHLSFYNKLKAILAPLSPNIIWNDNPSVKEQLEAVEYKGDNIQYIKNPTEKVQLKAIWIGGGDVIRYIDNPSEKVQLSALNAYPDYASDIFPLIKNPSEKVILKALSLAGELIEHINDPSEKMQLTAVKSTDGGAFEYIKNPTPTVQLAAVKLWGDNIRHIVNPSEQIQIAAIKQDSYAIRYIDNPSEKLKLLAASRDGASLPYIKDPSEAVKMAAVKNYGIAIEHIDNPSDELKKAAVSTNPGAIQYIKKPSEELQLIAVENEPDSIRYIRKPTIKVLELAIKLAKANKMNKLFIIKLQDKLRAMQNK